MRYVLNGIEYTKEEVVHRYLPLVKHIARRHYARAPRCIDVGDLVHEGVLGLIDALHKFDSSRNVKFETYAGLRINGAVIDALRASDWAPRSVRESTRRAGHAYTELEVSLHRAPTASELADQLDVTIGELDKITQDAHTASIRSLNESVAHDSDYDVALGDTLPDKDQDVTREVRRDEAREELRAAVQQLPRQERNLITLLYFKGVSVKDVAAMMSVTPSRVSQVRSKALVRLREIFRAAPWFEVEHYQDLVA